MLHRNKEGLQNVLPADISKLSLVLMPIALCILLFREPQSLMKSINMQQQKACSLHAKRYIYSHIFGNILNK